MTDMGRAAASGIGAGCRGSVVLSPMLAAACSAAPAQNLLGSFFPAWILCAAIGVCAAVACRLLLAAAGIAGTVPAAPLCYLAFAAAVTLLVWLLWFGH